MRNAKITETGHVAATRDGLDTERESGWRSQVGLFELLVVLGVFVYNVPILPGLVSSTGELVALVMLVAVGLCGPYLLRRRCPLVVLGVMLVAAFVQLLAGPEAAVLAGDVMLLFAVHNVASRYVWPVSLSAAAAVVVWLLVATVPNRDELFLSIGEIGLFVVVIAWVWTWGTLVRVRRKHVATLEERARHLEREQESRARIAVAEERARIAREIHDVVSHSLSVVVVVSDGAASTVDRDPERARAAMLSVRDTGRSALGEMRRMLGVLRDDEPGSEAPQPGIALLDRLVEDSRAAGMPVDFSTEGETVEVPAGVGLSVYRIVQEALTNVRKHAGPSVSRVEVWLRYGTDGLEVRVTDDGYGTDSGPGREHPGHGLVGMRERAAAYGGTVQTGARLSGGFAVTATLPIGGDA